jgi:hypothetical protein
MNPLKILKKYGIAAVLLCPYIANAQLVSGDVFLQGNFVEVGIAPNGAFGSGGSAPSGYHPKGASGIGFVADPDKDGWTVGSPTYFGDYFLPGTPQEGWDVSVNGSSSSAWRGYGPTSMTGSLSGSNVSYTSSGLKRTGVWQGAVGDLAITQTTTLQSNKLYFVVNVEFVNTGTTTLRDIYYNRSVDPDNEVTVTSDYKTKNKVVFKLPGSPSNKTLVTGIGLTYASAYLGLGTKDCRARPYIINSSLVPTTNLAELYNGTGSAAAYTYDTTSKTEDVGIGIVFKLDSLLPGKSTSVAYAYILREVDLDSAFLDITPRWRYRDVSYNSGDTIHPCKGSVIDLRIENAGYYDSWSWTPTTGLSDPSSATNVVTVGTTPITYTATGSSSFCPGSNITTTIRLEPIDGPVAPTVVSPLNLCRGVTASALTASPSTGLKWYTTASGLTALSGAPVPTTGTEGTTSFYVATDNGTCEGPRSKIDVIVTKFPKPAISSPQKFCVGDGPMTLGGVTGTNLKWYTTASGGSGTGTTPVIPTTGVGYFLYYVTQSSSIPGCESDRDTISAIVSAKPVLNLTLDGLTPKFANCFRTGMLLKAESSITPSGFKWYRNGGLIPGSVTDTIIPLLEGKYSVKVRDINGCSDSTFIVVYKDTAIHPTISPTDIYTCPGNIVRLYCRPLLSAYTFAWEKNGAPYADVKPDERNADEAGEYVVKVTEAGGCEFYTNRVTVTHYPVGSKPYLVHAGSNLQVSRSFARYQWYRNNKLISGATGRNYAYSFDGKYFAQVWDANECSQLTDTITLRNLSVQDTRSNGSIAVYPNPTNDKLFIDVDYRTQLWLSDMSGRVLLKAVDTKEISLNGFASGMYILRVEDVDQIREDAFIKIEKNGNE